MQLQVVPGNKGMTNPKTYHLPRRDSILSGNFASYVRVVVPNLRKLTVGLSVHHNGGSAVSVSTTSSGNIVNAFTYRWYLGGECTRRCKKGRETKDSHGERRRNKEDVGRESYGRQRAVENPSIFFAFSVSCSTCCATTDPRPPPAAKKDRATHAISCVVSAPQRSLTYETQRLNRSQKRSTKRLKSLSNNDR